ncbi:MAG: hypothetical protein IPJ19_11335 [Planctomycetes bacterium]|nr:hypothetical protein [Planctomycetota bacterium]
MRHHLALLFVYLCFLPFAACGTTRPDPKWISGEVACGSEDVLWETTRMALVKNSFPVGAGIEPAHMTAVSGWAHSLAPFRGQGFRERCHIKWTRVDTGRWRLDVRVERDRNDDISHPLDMTYAQWEPDPDDEERARLVTQYIRSLLSTH